MARVPTQVNSPVAPNQNLRTMVEGSASPLAFGSANATALAGLGEAAGGLLNTLSVAQKTRQLSQAQLDFNNNLTQAEIAMNESIRNADPSGKYLAEDAQNAALRALNSEELLQRVPAEFRDKFALDSQKAASRFTIGAIQAEIKQTGDFEAKNINQFVDNISSTWVRDNATYDDFANGIETIAQQIQNTSLSEAEKNDLFDQAKTRLLQNYLTGKQMVENAAGDIQRNYIQTAPAGRYSKPLDPATGQPFRGSEVVNDQSVQFLRFIEGYRSTAYADKNTSTGAYAGHRVGFGSDTWTDASGRVHKVTPNTTITENDAIRDVYRRVGNQSNMLQNLTDGKFLTTSDGVQTAVHSVIWNYGEGSPVVKRMSQFINEGNIVGLANYIGGLKANPTRREQEKNLILSGNATQSFPRDITNDFTSSTVFNDPFFAGLPFDDKVSAFKDSWTNTNREEAEAERERQQYYKNRIELLNRGVIDGTTSFNDLQKEFTNGNIKSSDYLSLSKRLDGQNETLNLARAGAGLVFGTSGRQVMIGDSSQKKELGAFYEQNMSKSFQDNDSSALDALAQMSNNALQIPDNLRGAIGAKIRSGNADDLMFGFSAMRTIRANQPDLFDKVFTESEQSDYTLANQLALAGNTKEQILEALRSNQSVGTEDVQRRRISDARAQLSRMDRNSQTLLTQISDEVIQEVDNRWFL